MTEDLIVNAANDLAAILTPNFDMLDSTWATLTCREAEAFAALFHATGHDLLADSVIEGHATSDEEGDDHYDGPILTARIGDQIVGPNEKRAFIETIGAVSMCIRYDDGTTALIPVY